MSEPRVVMDGILFGESTRWHDGRVWFTDWAAQQVIAVDLDGHHEVITRVESFPFCIAFSPDGELIVVSAAHQKVFRLVGGDLVVVADLEGMSDHPWNDIVVDGRGNTYVNNLGYEFGSEEPTPPPGFVVLVRPDGSSERVADGFSFPNGIAVLPDGETLIVAESHAGQLTAFDIAADGSLSNRRVWADLGDDAPDGICVDAEGAVWYASVPGEHCVRVAEGGEVLQRVAIDRGAFSCALGGDDRKTLVIVGQSFDPSAIGTGEPSGQILAVEVDVPGAGWP